MPGFLDDITESLGGGVRVSSGFRSQAEQDGLVAKGVTRAKHSAHSSGTADQPGAVDLVGAGNDAASVARRLTKSGFPVARAIYETGHGPNQGTGEHIHVEFGQPKNATPAVVAASSTPASQAGDALDAFANEGAIRDANKKVGEQGAIVNDVLGQTSAELESIQAQRIANIQDANKKKEVILADIDSQTRELQDRVKPIFVKRAAIAHRRTELTEMNPFKKAILGIFNKNYNEEHLAEVDGALANEASAVGQEFQVTNQLESTLMDVVNGRYTGQEAESNARAFGANQEIEIANRGWNIARQQFSDAVAGVTTGVELARAQAFTRTTTLSQMTAGEINSAVAQARKGGGTAMIAGVPISLAELEERGTQLEQQDLAIEGQRIGVQSAKISLQRNQEERLISHMSAADLDTAIKADGTFRGVKLDQGMLTQAYASKVQRTTLMAGEALTNVDSANYTAQIDAYSGRMRDGMRRVQGVVGSRMPPAYEQYVTGMVTKSRDFTAKLRAAPEAARPKLRAQFLQELNGMMLEQDKVVDKVVGGMTNQPDAAFVLKSYMTGNQPTGEQAVRGVIALVQGGALPPGIKLSGPAASAIKAAKEAIDGVYAQHGGQVGYEAALAGKGSKESKDELRRQMSQAVTKKMASAWDNGNMQTVINQVPLMAQAAGHPAGRINMNDYRASLAQGDEAGYSRLATQLGWGVSDVKSVFGPGGSREAGYKKIAGDDAKTSYANASSSLKALQTQEFMRALDLSPSATHDFKPSAAFAEFMKSPQLANQIGNWSRTIGHTGFGEMLADSVSGGSLGQKMFSYGNVIGQAHGALELENQAETRTQAANYRGSPLRRAEVILGAIPGLNKHDEQLLLSHLKDQMGTPPAVMAGPRGAMPGSGTRANQIDSLITSSKFADPKLEKIRQIAAKHWTDYSASTDSALDRLWNGMTR